MPGGTAGLVRWWSLTLGQHSMHLILCFDGHEVDAICNIEVGIRDLAVTDSQVVFCARGNRHASSESGFE